MNNKKKMIIYVMIGLIILILIVVILLINILKQGNSEDDELLESKEGLGNQIPISLIRTNNVVTYYTVDDCIKAYLDMLEVEDSSVLLTYLNEKYINDNHIREDNILTILEKYNDYQTYRTVEMYELSNYTIVSYYVKGRIDHKNVYFTVHLDVNQQTFDILPISEESYNSRIKDKESLDNNEVETIDKKTYNSFVYRDLNDEVISKLYFADYIKAMLTDSEEAYRLLDDEYREKRFDTIDKFNNFIQDNQDRLTYSFETEDKSVSDYDDFDQYYENLNQNENFGLKQYSVEEFIDYTRYVCVDGCNNYYIFFVTNPGEYKVMVDSYTIDLEEFTEKYNSSSSDVKVGMNTQKITEAINAKDYQYVYNKLDDTFKTNYPTVDSLKEDIENNLFHINLMEYTDFSQEGDVYIYQLTVKDAENIDTTEKKLTMIMDLQEGTDFRMSFSIE